MPGNDESVEEIISEEEKAEAMNSRINAIGFWIMLGWCAVILGAGFYYLIWSGVMPPNVLHSILLDTP